MSTVSFSSVVSRAELITFDNYLKAVKKDTAIKKLNINTAWRVGDLHILRTTMVRPRRTTLRRHEMIYKEKQSCYTATSGPMRRYMSQNEKSLLWIQSPDEFIQIV